MPSTVFPPPDGQPLRSGVPLPTAVRITNARALPEAPQLDREGFQLIDFADLIPTDLVYRDKVGETYSFTANPEHRWLYYPELQTSEALLLKSYDSNTPGTARLTAAVARGAARTYIAHGSG